MAERTDYLTIALTSKDEDIFTFTVTRYTEGGPHNTSRFFSWLGWRWMGVGRRALDIGHWSLIFENWKTRQ